MTSPSAVNNVDLHGFAATPPPSPEEAKELCLKDTDLPQRTEAEQEELLNRVKLVAQVFSGVYGIEFLPSPENGWAVTVSPQTMKVVDDYYSGKRASLDDLPKEAFLPNVFLYSPKYIAERPEVDALGATRHEIGHIRRTDFRLFFQGQKMALDQGHLGLTYGTFFNGVEDCWINIAESAESPIAHKQIEACHVNAVPNLINRINDASPIHQLSLNVIYYWLYGESIPTLRDKRVIKAFEGVKPYLEDYFYGASAADNYALIRDKMWPHVRELEEHVIKDNMLNSLSSKSKNRKPSESENEQLDPEGKATDGQPGNSSTNAGGGSKNFIERAREALGLKKKSDTNEPKNQEVPEAEREELERKLNSKSPQERKKIEEKARADLDAAQAKEQAEDNPMGLKVKRDPKTGENYLGYREPLSKGDLKKAREEQKKIEQEQEKLETQQIGSNKDSTEASKLSKKENEKQDARLAGFGEKELSLYRQYRSLEDAAQPQVERILGHISREVPRVLERQFEGANFAGPRINLKELARRVPIGDGRIYERPEFVPGDEAKLFLVLSIDNSGSMAGEKMAAARTAMVALAKLGQVLKSPFAATVFDSDVHLHKGFNDDFEDSALGLKPKLLYLTQADGGSTNIDAALIQAEGLLSEGCQQFNHSLGVIFLVSDGGANSGRTGAELARYVKELQQRFVVVNFMLNASSGELSSAREIFGAANVIEIPRIEELGDRAGRELARIFVQIQSKNEME